MKYDPLKSRRRSVPSTGNRSIRPAAGKKLGQLEKLTKRYSHLQEEWLRDGVGGAGVGQDLLGCIGRF